MSIPKDPVMRLSFVNTQLRDHYKSLDEFINELSFSDEPITKEELINSLEKIDFHYSPEKNQFI